MIYVYRAVLVSRLCPVEISLTRRIITTCWHKRDNYESGVRSSNLFGRASKRLMTRIYSPIATMWPNYGLPISYQIATSVSV